jgi:hypothetical protein
MVRELTEKLPFRCTKSGVVRLVLEAVTVRRLQTALLWTVVLLAPGGVLLLPFALAGARRAAKASARALPAAD